MTGFLMTNAMALVFYNCIDLANGLSAIEEIGIGFGAAFGAVIIGCSMFCCAKMCCREECFIQLEEVNSTSDNNRSMTNLSASRAAHKPNNPKPARISSTNISVVSQQTSNLSALAVPKLANISTANTFVVSQQTSNTGIKAPVAHFQDIDVPIINNHTSALDVPTSTNIINNTSISITNHNYILPK